LEPLLFLGLITSLSLSGPIVRAKMKKIQKKLLKDVLSACNTNGIATKKFEQLTLLEFCCFYDENKTHKWLK